jgi:hypothetical protein
MKNNYWHYWCGLALLMGATSSAWSAENPSVMAIKESPNELAVYYKQQKVLVYTYAPSQFKPYVQEFYALGGVDVLRDAPADHLHHHGLMYAIKVNGINFWEETPAAGIQRPVKLLDQGIGATPSGLPQATFTQLIHWIAQPDKALADTALAALLVERRTITVTIDETHNKAMLQWTSAFEVGPKTNKVVLTGSNYHGLGMRFRKEFDAVAKHLNSEQAPDLSGGKQNVSRAKWSAVFFDAPGHPATVVLSGSPVNLRGDPHFFTMLTPFAYLSATQGLDQQPLEYKGGDKFSLTYCLVVYPELKSPEFIRKAAQ